MLLQHHQYQQQSLLGEEKLDDELQKRLENDPTHEDLLYENLMSIFDINKDGELSLHELVIGTFSE
jgi:hypothetical protein